jgi:uncharacterized protein YbaR (Trm112 family)
MNCHLHSEIFLFENEEKTMGYCNRCKRWYKLEDIEKEQGN